MKVNVENIEKNFGDISQEINNYYLESKNLRYIIEKIEIYFERFQGEKEIPVTIQNIIYSLAMEAISYKDCTHEELQYLYAVLGDLSSNLEERMKYYKKAIKEINDNQFSKIIKKEYYKTLIKYFFLSFFYSGEY